VDKDEVRKGGGGQAGVSVEASPLSEKVTRPNEPTGSGTLAAPPIRAAGQTWHGLTALLIRFERGFPARRSESYPGNPADLGAGGGRRSGVRPAADRAAPWCDMPEVAAAATGNDGARPKASAPVLRCALRRLDRSGPRGLRGEPQ
jgi:hypothetical protein